MNIFLRKRSLPYFALLYCSFFSINSFADDTDKLLPTTGNFALSSSQQPGPLVSFGQNVIDKNQFQVFAAPSDLWGKDEHFATLSLSYLYGITDDLSIYINTPFAMSYKQDDDHSSGPMDSSVQFEYAFSTINTSTYQQQATVVASMTFPTGSPQKNPSTGVGALSYFLGTTLSRLYEQWYGFVSPGIQVNTADDGTRFGNTYLYQAGIERNFLTIDHQWIFAGLIELDGQYSAKDKIDRMINPNSGGNVIFLTPSLWLSSQKLIVQVGFGFPIAQHLFGDQPKSRYLIAANVAWTLN